MRILQLKIGGFRSIQNATVNFDRASVIVGPNGCGKSTLIEALALVLGRDRMVRNLTEHDFYGSAPSPTTRISICATIGGFERNDPNAYADWFRDGRGIPTWWNRTAHITHAEQSPEAEELCVRIGFAARFDQDDLTVESIRYFWDSDDMEDPFAEEGVQRVPGKLISEIGFFLIPSARTWDRLISFGSELFSRLIASVEGLPAGEILDARDRLRNEMTFQQATGFRKIIDSINQELSLMFPEAPALGFRLTATDSEAVLRSITPHFSVCAADHPMVPSSRQGSGLLSLQTLLLLLEFGKHRRANRQNFILALEEPELHVSPGMQKRIIHRASRASDQIICTTHSSRVASFFAATGVRAIENNSGVLAATPLLLAELGPEARNYERKLFYEYRQELVEALLHPIVLVTEGRIDKDWLELLVRSIETSATVLADRDLPGCLSPFVGFVASAGSQVAETCLHIRGLRHRVAVLVDGDQAGSGYITQLLDLDFPPFCIVQLPAECVIEDLVGRLLAADENAVCAFLSEGEHIAAAFAGEDLSIPNLVAKMKVSTSDGGLKTNYLAYREIAAALSSAPGCLSAVERHLTSMHDAVVRMQVPAGWQTDERSTEATRIFRMVWP